MSEATVKPQEIKLIDPRRTSLIAAPQREEKRITEREYRRMLRKWALAFGASLGINIAQAVMIYILQAGTI